MPAYVLNGFLVSFAAYKKHIGLYPAPSGDDAFNQRLAPFRADMFVPQVPPQCTTNAHPQTVDLRFNNHDLETGFLRRNPVSKAQDFA